MKFQSIFRKIQVSFFSILNRYVLNVHQCKLVAFTWLGFSPVLNLNEKKKKNTENVWNLKYISGLS